MKIAVASDHRGFKLKNRLAAYLKEKGHSVIDFGTFSDDPCDYPDVVIPAALAVKKKKAERAVLICYSGIGTSIAANRFKGVRAALVFNMKMAWFSRKHNNSNVLVLASGFIKADYAKKIVTRWLSAGFEGGRHLRRLKKIENAKEREDV